VNSSDDIIYQQATGQLPGQGETLFNPDDELTDQDVLSFIGQHAGTVAMTTFPLRMEPGGGHPGDKVFYAPVPTRDPELFIAIGFRFGYPSADQMENYKARWASLNGPMTRQELGALR
jgi:hypothetical protein